MGEEEKQKVLNKAKSGLIDLAVSYLNTKSGLGLLGIDDDELKLFIGDKERRNQLIKENSPRLVSYEIRGRLFNKNTNSPLEGVKINPVFCIIEGPPPISDSQGKYKTTITIPVVGDEKQGIENSVLKSQLFYSKENFSPSQQVLINRDNTVKTDLSTIDMLDINYAAEEIDKEIQIKLDGGINKLAKLSLSGVDKIIILRRLAINKVTNVVKLKLIPLALQIFILFGVVKIQDISKGISCPSPDLLNSAISKRNKVVRQLNQIYKTIVINSALAGVALYLSFQLKGIISQINTLAFPLASPPGIGLPYTIVGTLDGIKNKLNEISEDNKKLNKQIIISLAFLVAALIIVLIYLKRIDGMIQECAQNSNLEPLSPELSSLREENERADTSSSNTDSNLNGFIFNVVDDKSEVGNLKRRFAIAKNVDGVVLLRGEPSFSANDQILIDELKFYIQQNKLKAF